MSTFIRAANPLWYFPDLTGNPLDDTYYAFFLTNTLPYIPQRVYHDDAGQTAWDNPIQFSPAGTLPIDMYFDNSLVYRIEIRHGNTQADQLVWLIENYQPGDDGIIPDPSITVATDNQITNPQFSSILFPDTDELTGTGVTDVVVPVAPGWEFVGVGTGNYTISRVSLPADQNIVTNPPYALSVVLSGAWSTAYLRQRFEHNAGLWANKFVSTSVTARSNDGAPYVLRAMLVRDDGDSALIFQDTLNSAYAVFPGAVELGVATSSTDPSTSWTEFRIVFPNVIQTSLTSVQLIGQDTGAEIPYDEDTLERQHDHMFHYYEDSILLMPKDTILAGWNFAQNPYQFRSTTPANVAVNQYVADQTIIIQQNYVATATGNNVSVGRGSLGDNLPLLVTAVTASNKFAVLQYLDPTETYAFWGRTLSALLRAKLTTTHGTEVRVKMRLIYRTTIPATITQSEPVASWGASSEDPTFSAGWNAVAPLNDPIYTLTSSYQDMPFDQFDLSAIALSSANQTIGVLIYTIDAMNQTATADSIQIASCSLVRNDFAIDVNPMSDEETYARCEFYYESTFLPGVVAPAASAVGALQAPMTSYWNGATTVTSYPQPFGTNLRTLKRTAPALTFYSGASTTANNVESHVVAQVGSPAAIERVLGTFWSSVNSTNKNFRVDGAASGGALQSTGAVVGITHPGACWIQYHYIADARIGI